MTAENCISIEEHDRRAKERAEAFYNQGLGRPSPCGPARPMTDAELKDREIDRLRAEANERFRMARQSQPFIPVPILQPFERDVLVLLISGLGGRAVRSREMDLCLTKLQEALHWADAPVNVPEGGRW